MSFFAVLREPGPVWDRSRPMRRQDGWDAHASFMDALADEGFIVLGGPVGDGLRFLFLVKAESEAAIESRFAEDPWVPAQMLRLVRIEAWEILLGRSRA
ncbi:MAG TPA: hypothetical protein VFL28_08375 [bacterium]|nr:hypothetical protein [bacterium]